MQLIDASALSPSSTAFKTAIRTLCPNTQGLNTPEWLGIAAPVVGINAGRLKRLWRDARTQPEPSEDAWLDYQLELHRAKHCVKKALNILEVTDELSHRLLEIEERLQNLSGEDAD